jgi:hypothetical protein
MADKYTVRFSNGFWKLFNNHAFRDAGIFPLKSLAEAALKRAA